MCDGLSVFAEGASVCFLARAYALKDRNLLLGHLSFLWPLPWCLAYSRQSVSLC